MKKPFSKRISLSRALCLILVICLTASLFSGCELADLLPGSHNSETTEAPTEPVTETTVPPTTETAPAPVTETTAPPTTEAPKENIAIVKEQLSLRASPSSGARVITQLDAGEEIEVLRVEPIGTVEWAFVNVISLDVMGWIVTNMLDMSNVTLASGTTATPNNTGSTEGTTGSGTIPTAPSATTKAAVDPITGSGSNDTGGQKGVIIANDLNIRSTASTNGDRVGSYNYGDRISILETKDGWGRTNKGWISLNYVYLDGNVGTNTATATVSASALNVRSGPGTGYDKVKSLSQGERVNILEQIKVGNESWGYVTGGWINLDYVRIEGASSTSTVTTPTGSAQTGTSGVITADVLNIRSVAGTGSVVGGYHQGDVVTILETTTVGTTKWGRTDKGWISMDYVRVS